MAHRRGFTLLEVIIALAIVVVLMTGVFVFYHRVSSAREKVMAQVQAIASTRLVMDHITNELRYATKTITFGGESDRVYFYASLLPGPSIWAVTDVTESTPPPQSDRHYLEFRLRVTQPEDEDDQPIIEGVERVSRAFVPITGADEDQVNTSTLLSAHIKFIRLQYWNGQTWLATWNDSGIPTAVELVIGVEPLPEDTEPAEYPYQTFRRVIFLPQSERDQQTPTIRGLEDGAL